MWCLRTVLKRILSTNQQDLPFHQLNWPSIIPSIIDFDSGIDFCRDKDILSSYGMNFNLKVTRAAESDELNFYVISESWGKLLWCGAYLADDKTKNAFFLLNCNPRLVGLDLNTVFTPFYSGNHLRNKTVRATPIELDRQKRIVPPKSDSPKEVII